MTHHLPLPFVLTRTIARLMESSPLNHQALALAIPSTMRMMRRRRRRKKKKSLLLLKSPIRRTIRRLKLLPATSGFSFPHHRCFIMHGSSLSGGWLMIHNSWKSWEAREEEEVWQHVIAGHSSLLDILA